MAPFYGWGSTASRLEPLRGGSLLFTTNDVINFKIDLRSSYKAMTDKVKKRGRRKYKNLNISRTKKAF